MPKRITVSLHADVVNAVLPHKPSRKSLTQFLEDLIESTVDGQFTMGGAQGGPPSLLAVNKEEEERVRAKPKASKAKDPYASKKVSKDLIPDDLAEHADLWVDWWAIRKGVRSERSWFLNMGKFRALPPGDRHKALENAYNSGWASIFPPKPDTPQQGKWKEPEPKHPAYMAHTESEGERKYREETQRLQAEADERGISIYEMRDIDRRRRMEAKWPESQTNGKGVLSGFDL